MARIHDRARPRASLAVITFALVTALSGCTNGNKHDEAEAKRLMQTSREWSRAVSTGDMNAVLNYWADDAVLISAGQPPVRGKAALRSYLAETSKIPGFRISWEPVDSKVSGDMGYMIERTQITMNGPDSAPRSQMLQAVTIWRKQPDGTWKNVVDASTPAAPALAKS
jgi:uncharacterized protein (TIGR02246 family)